VFALPLQTRLYAALVHGEFANAYLFSGNMPSGTNAVVEVIHRSFLTLWCFTNRLPLLNTHCFIATPCRTLLAYIDKNGKLPGTWFLQLDNTCK